MKGIVITLVLLFSFSALAKEKKVTIDHSDLSPQKITGALGKPLGTMLQIEGTVVDGDTLRQKALMGQVLLQVEQVAGKKLNSKQLIRFETPGWAGVKRPKPGDKIKYLGYETGGMTGIPSAAFKHIPQMTTTDHHFQVYFVVCKQGA